MIYKTHNGQICNLELADLIFSVFDSFGNRKQIQHVALSNSEKLIHVQDATVIIPVIEVVHHSQFNSWPSGQYVVNVVGKMMITDSPITFEQRKSIIEHAHKIERRTRTLIDLFGEKSCEPKYDENYKLVIPDYNDYENALEMHFSCCGFVEYCYEICTLDIVLDGQKGEFLPTVIHGGQRKTLFPGYQIKAFEIDDYPLDLINNLASGLRADDIKLYPFN